MNDNNNLNKLMDTIEKELESKIDYKKLAQMIGTSSYTLQRIFTFLTGITLAEYIRKRRLSKAAEEIQKTDHKIIDIAMKYQYDSPVSFSNAFKKMYGESPINFRKNNAEIKIFPKIEFHPTTRLIKEFKYKIIELEEQTFYGKTTGVIADTDKKTIQELYSNCKKDRNLRFYHKK